MPAYAHILTLPLVILLAAGCQKGPESVTPADLDGSSVCAADGMRLLSYDGPKAQLVAKNGQRKSYCDFREAVEVILNPVEKARIAEIFVQDFGGGAWGSYPNRWIAAESAYFVIDSEQMGAMGVTYVPFSTVDAAEAFRKLHGGRIVRLHEINSDVYQSSMALQRERLKSMGQ